MDPAPADQRPDAPRRGQPPLRVPFWASLLSHIPLPAWYGLAALLAWLAEHAVSYRRELINSQLRKCFPALDDAAIGRIRRDFYRNFADVVVEIVKAMTMSPAQFRARVQLLGAESIREHVSAGRSVVLAASHHCNWEWALQALSLDLGCPLVIPYKQVRDRWADRLLLAMRSRFGATMISSRRLPIHVMRRRKQPMAIAIAADQAPAFAGAHHLALLFGQETAFYEGPEAIARSIGAPMFFVAMRRTGRGHYEVVLEPLVCHAEQLEDGAWIERYARRMEQQIRASPPDWLWSYRRWKARRDAGSSVSV